MPFIHQRCTITPIMLKTKNGKGHDVAAVHIEPVRIVTVMVLLVLLSFVLFLFCFFVLKLEHNDGGLHQKYNSEAVLFGF